MPANIWPKARDEELMRLHALVPHLSARQIAVELNCGITRNAVIGRIHRLNLPLRGKCKAALKVKKSPKRTQVLRVVRANSNSTQLRMYEAAQIEIAPLRCAEIMPLNLSLVDLALNDCRYPVTGDAPFLFCGHPKMEGSSYCRPHFGLSLRQTRTNSEAVSQARAKRIRGINFRRALLEAAP
jgi:GcrA cell cycle regulator